MNAKTTYQIIRKYDNSIVPGTVNFNLEKSINTAVALHNTTKEDYQVLDITCDNFNKVVYDTRQIIVDMIIDTINLEEWSEDD